jgi:beta-lactam-binding protein with PASTA domain
MLGVAFICLAGCAVRSGCPTIALLQRVSTADGAEGVVVVKRDGRVVPWAENMPLERGDLVTTDGRTSAVLSFAGSQTLLKPDTSVTLGTFEAPAVQDAVPSKEKASVATAKLGANACQLKAAEGNGTAAVARKPAPASAPASQSASKQEPSLLSQIFAWFGWLQVSGPMRTQSKLIDAKARGTKYDVRIDKQTSKATVTVIEGHVSVSPVQTGAPAILVPAGKRVAVEEQKAGELEVVPSAELEALADELDAMGRPLGPEVPDVVGLEIAAAEAKLRSLGIESRVVPSKVLTVDPSKRGQVLGQDPAARAHGERVALLVAAVEVPSVVGQTRAQAEASLKHAGIELGGVENPTHTSDPGAIVVAQNPDPGAAVAPGTYVLVTLAPSKPETAGDAASGTASPITVPDVTGAAPAAALETLRAAGLLPWVEASVRPDVGEARVTYQEPLPGQRARAGARVRVVVAHPAPGKEH